MTRHQETMRSPPLHRHQLAWLTDEAWAALRHDAGESDAAECLMHWHQADLPLVVTQQRVQRQAADSIALGLPAPGWWNRRRIALQVAPRAIRRCGEFPVATDATPLLPEPYRARWQSLCRALAASGASVRVHGSYGWQLLTGLDHVRPGSDLDLTLSLSTLQQADATVALLQGWPAQRPRLDGEFVFPGGHAIAWREWQAWRAGSVRSVLVKHLDGNSLATCLPWLEPRVSLENAR